MNQLTIYALKALRKTYGKVFHVQPPELPYRESDPDKASDMIYNLLMRDEPCMIARFGAVEMSCINNYLCIKKHDTNIFKYIKGEIFDWWWNEGVKFCMTNNAGFFPSTEDKLSQFCELMIADAKEVDVLGVFDSVRVGIREVENYMNNPQYLQLYTFDPFTSKKPWSRALLGKKVLVIHPFASLIERQYSEKRKLLFKDENVLPEFDLKTIRAVQSIGGESNGFKDWFEALHWMEEEMDRTDYDICLIGCGAYGFPLAAHAKRMGKKAVHIGGSLQLLFGIKGRRWENPTIKDIGILPHDFYIKLFNSSWVRPDQYRNEHSNKVENACYW